LEKLNIIDNITFLIILIHLVLCKHKRSEDVFAIDAGAEFPHTDGSS